MGKNSIKIQKKNSILFVASECNPFAGTGGLADVIGSLPKALANNCNFDVRVVAPLYKDFATEYRDKLKFVTNFNVPLSWRNQYCGIFTYTLNNVIFYFIDNEYYFKRDGLYGYFDDGERFAYFSKATVEMLKVIDFYPNIMHCHDWQTAMSIVYLKTLFNGVSGYNDIKTIFTIHNIEYQGKYGKDQLGDLFGIGNEYLDVLEYDGCLNLMKGAMVLADKISTVSPTYASEIKYDFFSHGLSAITQAFEGKTLGILNGIDESLFDPRTNKSLFSSYDVDNLQGKSVCKKELQKMLNLPERDVPLISMISRLVAHKGLDLVKAVVDELLCEDVQLVILGKGEAQYEEFFRYIQERYPNKCRAVIAYNRDLSTKIYSGSDIFLMPSKQEPCGLSQMMAAKYGTVPIVRKTGGLADSITPYNRDKENGIGFNFENYNAHEMLFVIKDAIYTYQNKAEWLKIMKRAMNTDFSWQKSAKVYELIYNELLRS